MISKNKLSCMGNMVSCVSWSAGLIASIFISVIFVMPVSGALPEQNVPVQVINKKISPKVQEFMERLNTLMSPADYTYSPAGKPDPFQPFIRSNSAARRPRHTENKTDKRPDRCATPLQCMDVGQLRLVAIVIEDDGNNLAMAQDASGIGYILKQGVLVGYRNGVVKAVLPDRVIIEEEAEDIRGDAVLAKRVLLLHPEEK